MSQKRKDVSTREDDTPVKKGKKEIQKRLVRTASGRLGGTITGSGYGVRFTPDMVQACVSNKLDIKVLKTLCESAVKLSNGVTVCSKFQWDSIDKGRLARVILNSFLNSTDYHKWNTQWLSTNVDSIYLKQFQEQFEPEELMSLPNLEKGMNNSTFGRKMLIPFVSRIKRTTGTIFRDFIAFVMCKVYEYKEKNNSLEVLGKDILESRERFFQEIGIKVPVLELPLEISADLNGDDEQSQMDQEDASMSQDEEEPLDEPTQDLKKANEWFFECAAAVRKLEASTEAKLNLVNGYAKDFDEKSLQAKRTAKQYETAAENVRRLLQKLTDEEAERKLLEEMRIPEDTVEDVRRLETRAKFIAQTIDVVFPNLTDEEREEFLSGRKDLPWERFEISFLSAEPM